MNCQMLRISIYIPEVDTSAINSISRKPDADRISNKLPKVKFTISNKEAIHAFWVGLMDGDGSIQVNHWKKRCLQYRMIIKLKYTLANYEMLCHIKQHFGGTVVVENKQTFVKWAINNKKQILYLLSIFQQYRPMTTRLNCQILFLQKCMQLNNVDWYLANRSAKYDISETVKVSQNDILNCGYFHYWLSGFIEAESCFTLRVASSKRLSFSLSQKNDRQILEAVKTFFNANNNVRQMNTNMYILEIYSRTALQKVITHCETYPLLGEKNRSFQLFRKVFMNNT